ncbi:MAG: hypothetical protein LQ339_005231 [Xanthoria mediterranea]|nr:MAG: hypothetical protein LQ339_005231 [Xanthoria mediterranea]
MQFKAPSILALSLLLSSVAADCRTGGKHIGDSCAKSDPGDKACGDHRILVCDGKFNMWAPLKNCPQGEKCETCDCMKS